MSEQMTVNSTGGKQHKVSERYEAGFPFAEDAVARLRAEGHDVHGYEDDNYLKIPANIHVARAKRHITKWQMGDTEDGTALEHLVHAICRLEMAYTELLMEAKEQPKIIVPKLSEEEEQQLRYYDGTPLIERHPDMMEGA